MKKLQLLLIMLFCSAVSALAQAKAPAPKVGITASVEAVEGRPSFYDIVVSMACADEQVRTLQCDFTLPESLTKIGIPTYNEARFGDSFIATLDLRDRNSKETDHSSRFTFFSLDGDYVAGGDGEIFRFTVQCHEEEVGFTILSEVCYDNDEVDERVPTYVTIKEASPYNVTALTSSVSVDEEATISLAIEATDVPVAGFEMVVELPQGVEFVTNAKGKVDWTFSSRVSKLRSVSDKQPANGKVKLMVIDAASSELIGAGAGEFLSFRVKSPKGVVLPEGSAVTIHDIKVSKLNGKQFNQPGTITVAVEKSALPGDVDCNGVIDGADLVTLRNVIMSNSTDTAGLNLDVNGDGEVNGADLVDLREIILHLK